MDAMILAGGLGVRLHPLTKVLPKPLLPIGERAVLEIQIERLRSYGIKNVYLSTNYKSAFIESYFKMNPQDGISLTVIKEEVPLGTAGPVRLLKDKLSEPFILMNGDILTLLDFGKFYDFALQEKTCLTVAIKRHITPFAFGNIFFEDNHVTRIEEKKDLINYILTRIYVMTPEIFDHIPDNAYYGMDHLIQSLLKKQIPVSVYKMDEYWLDIGQIDDLQKAEEEYTAEINRLGCEGL